MAFTRSLFSFLACLPALAQTPIFKSDTNLQSIAVQVTGRQDTSIQGLSAADFTLLEDGKPQKIAFFGAENQPVSLAVLIDSSASMNSAGKLDRARELLGPLLRGNRPDDEIFVMPFTERVEAFTRLTADQRLHPPPASAFAAGGTALYDALASALCHMRTAENIRQAVVVITDGADQHSRLTLDQLLQLAKASNPQIFMIGFFNPAEAVVFRERAPKITLIGERDIDNPAVVFESLAKESGAESFFPSSARDLKQALDRISAVLEGQYTLAYYPRDTSRLRKIEVRVKRRGVRVVSRRDVGAASGAETVHFSASSCEVSKKEHPFPWELRISRGPSGEPVYHEDFSDPHSGWPIHSETTPDISLRGVGRTQYRAGLRYVAGGYEISRLVHSNTPSSSPVGDGVVVAYGPSWTNFRASVALEGDLNGSRAGYLSTAAGLVFHLDSSGYEALLLTGAGHPGASDLSFKVIRKTFGPGEPVDLIPWTKFGAQVETKDAAKEGAAQVDTGIGNNVALANARSGSETKRRHTLSVEFVRGVVTLRIDDLKAATFNDHATVNGLIGLTLFGAGRVVFHDLSVEELQ